MDEPSSALDPLIRTRLQHELIELQRRLKRTMIFVSHDLEEAFKLANHIAIMEDGGAVQHGAPLEIVRARCRMRPRLRLQHETARGVRSRGHDAGGQD